MSEPKPLPPHLTGGNFLLTETNPDLVSTPEDLAAEQRLMAQTAGKFMEKEVLPNFEALEHQQEGLSPKLFRKAGELGLLGIEVPEAYGGLGLGKISGIGVGEQFTRLGGFGVTIGAHCGIGTQPLIYFGTEAQKKKYLSKLATGEWTGAYALSETGSGSDALGMRTKATLSPDGKHYVLNGAKMWISNAGWADLFTIFAKVDGQHVTAFLVERTFPGLSTGKEEHKLGIKSSSTRRVMLEDVKVPVENVLGEVGKGAYIAFNILNFGRFGLGAGAIGGAKDLLKVATRYALERQQFGKAIASFGLIQHKLAEMAAQIFAGESIVYRTAGMIDAVMATGELMDSMTPNFPRGLDEFALECSVIKVACSEIMDFVADETLQIHGGYGYTEEFPAARAYRDSRINRIFEGTNEINRLFIPGLLMRRAQRGRLPLLQAIAKISKDILDLAPFDDSAGGDELAAAQSLIANAKKLALMLAGVTYQKFGDKLIDEQEVLASLSDIISDIYQAESALLRTLKARQAGGKSTVMSDLTLIFVNDAAGRMEAHARQSLAATSEGDELRGQLGLVRRLLRWQPLNTVALRRRIAKRLCELGNYPALIEGK
ncbi:MAG TPA: acyl-CoA dehydrogenase family protein [Candidatus Eisenbacteria bacterium]|nr:acyl-CoA dehydrogenase family protein [Candidatus Eisenbacteria bacterium]